MRGGGLKAAGADCADCAATAAAAGAELTGTVVGLARVCRQAPSQWGSGTMATAASKSAAKGQQGLFAVAAEAERALAEQVGLWVCGCVGVWAGVFL